jgi:hypothetical protein
MQLKILVIYRRINLKNLLIVVAVLFLPACAPNSSGTLSSKQKIIDNQEYKDTSLNKKIYFFQHRLMPKWTHKSDGQFLSDLLNGDLSRLRLAAEQIVSVEYANNITVKYTGQSNSILLIFPKPTDFNRCYYVFLSKVDSIFHFITYEKTRDTRNQGFVGVVGSWKADTNHYNYGPRKYSDPDSFLDDAIRLSENKN